MSYPAKPCLPKKGGKAREHLAHAVLWGGGEKQGSITSTDKEKKMHT